MSETIAVSRSSLSNSSILGGVVALADIAISSTSGLIIYLFYVGWEDSTKILYLSTIIVTSVLIVAGLRYVGLYKFENLVNPVNVVRKVSAVALSVFILLIVLAFAFKVPFDFSRVMAFSWLMITVLSLSIGRIQFHAFLRNLIVEGRLAKTVAIVGFGEQGQRLLESVNEHQVPWLKVAGVFDDRLTRLDKKPEGIPLLGNTDDLIEYARTHHLDDIVLALPWSSDDRLTQLVAKLDVLPHAVNLSPDLAGYRFADFQRVNYGGVPVVNVRKRPLEGWGSIVKRVEDKVIGALILLMISPLMLIIAIAVKLDSKGPVFFKQNRYGFNNKLIGVLKFRSMYVDDEDTDASTLVTKNDPRVTRVGAFLRRTSLDELPQFINVIRGEMSVVGPRPHALKASAEGRLYEEVVCDYAKRHNVTPGITGWAQVNGWRGETDTEDKIKYRVEHDVYYIENWSVFFDIEIILRTLITGFTNKNAY